MTSSPTTEAGRDHLDYIRRWSEDEGATWTDFDTEELGGRIRKIEQQARDEGRREAVRYLHYRGTGKWPSEAGVVAALDGIDRVAGLNASESPQCEICGKSGHDAESCSAAEWGTLRDASESPPLCDQIVNNGFGEPTECGRTLPCPFHRWPFGDASESPRTEWRDPEGPPEPPKIVGNASESGQR